MQVKLFVGNLAWGVDDAQLEQVFQQHGDVQSARVIHDRDTGRSRGFGFVEMDVDDVSVVIRATDGLEIGGRPIRVNEAEDKGGPRGPRRDSGGGGYGGGGGGGYGGGGGGGGRRY
jgi:cold-inducible RNA-binding protein